MIFRRAAKRTYPHWANIQARKNKFVNIAPGAKGIIQKSTQNYNSPTVTTGASRTTVKGAQTEDHTTIALIWVHIPTEKVAAP